MIDDDIAKQVDDVLGDKVLADPESIWMHVECIHGAAHALGCGDVCHEMRVLGRRTDDPEFVVLMAQFVETQGQALRAWLRARGIAVYAPWIHHTLPDGASYFKLWSITA